jgi:hypothetical protein
MTCRGEGPNTAETVGDAHVTVQIVAIPLSLDEGTCQTSPGHHRLRRACGCRPLSSGRTGPVPTAIPFFAPGPPGLPQYPLLKNSLSSALPPLDMVDTKGMDRRHIWRWGGFSTRMPLTPSALGKCFCRAPSLRRVHSERPDCFPLPKQPLRRANAVATKPI